jgi:hypothetical protein
LAANVVFWSRKTHPITEKVFSVSGLPANPGSPDAVANELQ